MQLPGYYEYLCRVKIVSGLRVLEQIPELLLQLGSRRPMIVTDAGVSAAGLVDTVLSALADGIEVGTVSDQVPTDSPLPAIVALAQTYRSHRCDGIIAIGGGSVMDSAKAVNILVSEDSDDLMQFSGAGALKRPLRPLIALPTTAGTGSEVTVVAVVKDPTNDLKMPFVSYFLQPDVAVLDPRLTLTLPAAITAATAMDAMTHAIEAYTCLAKNPISDAHAQRAISLIGRHLPAVIENPADENGRLALANAATLAGMAFSNSMVGIVHALGHSVGGLCHAPHGNCMAILLPYGLEYNRHQNGALTGELLLPLAGDDVFAATPRHLRCERTIAAVRRLNQNLHEMTNGRHPRYLKELADREGNRLVPKERLPEIAAASLGDASRFYNPVEFDQNDALAILEAAWEGAPLAQ